MLRMQLRDAVDDPWASTAPDGPDVLTAMKDAGSKIASVFSTIIPATAVTVPATTATTPSMTVTTPCQGNGCPTKNGRWNVDIGPSSFEIAKAWITSPIGLIAIVAGGFVGYKYVLPKLRK